MVRKGPLQTTCLPPAWLRSKSLAWEGARTREMATKGARGRVLETTMVGGIRYTSIAALQQFIGDPVHGVSEEADDLTAAIERALDEAGL